MRKALCVVLLAVIAVAAKDRAKVPPAPLPSQLLTAKKVFVAKGVGATAHTVKGGYDLAFDSFYAEMKDWNRYEIVGSPDDANLVFEVSYRVENSGTRVWSSTNTDGSTQVHSAQNIDAQLTLTVYDGHTKTELWSTSLPPGRAFLHKNQEKEMEIAGQQLATKFQKRLEATAAAEPAEPSKAKPN